MLFAASPCDLLSFLLVREPLVGLCLQTLGWRGSPACLRYLSTLCRDVVQVLVRLVAWVFPDFELVWLAEETKKNLPRELDFSQEARNADRVADMFRHFSWLRVG